MTDDDVAPPEFDNWEDNFRRLIIELGMRADRRAKSTSEVQVCIVNMEAKRHLLQYGNDLIHHLYQAGFSEDGRETCFESLSLLLSGAFKCGALEEKDKFGHTNEPAGVLETIKNENKTGPAPVLRNRVKRAMLETLRSGGDLKSVKREALAAMYGASGGTVTAARREALSEFETENADKTLPGSDKL